MPLRIALYWSKEKRMLVSNHRRLSRCAFSSIRLDAQGDLLRGLQVVETAVGITSTLLGDKLEGAYHHANILQWC